MFLEKKKKKKHKIMGVIREFVLFSIFFFSKPKYKNWGFFVFLDNVASSQQEIKTTYRSKGARA